MLGKLWPQCELDPAYTGPSSSLKFRRVQCPERSRANGKCDLDRHEPPGPTNFFACRVFLILKASSSSRGGFRDRGDARTSSVINK